MIIYGQSKMTLNALQFEETLEAVTLVHVCEACA